MFAKNLSDFGAALTRKAVRFCVYKGRDKTSSVSHSIDGNKGYALGLEALIQQVMHFTPVNAAIEGAIRREVPLFPESAVREIVANALIHQDFSISGAGPMIELFEDRLEVSNPGKPLIETDRMIDLPPRSRNDRIASLMRRMGFCEERGTGLDKVISSIEAFQLPPPLFKSSDYSMQAILFGPKSFADMTPEERIRACYQHTCIKYVNGERMKNKTLCIRFGIDSKNAAQASQVIAAAIDGQWIKVADKQFPRSGYVPIWA